MSKKLSNLTILGLILIHKAPFIKYFIKYSFGMLQKSKMIHEHLFFMGKELN